MKILLVEDNPSIVAFLKKGLQEEAHAVDIASDGKEGFYLATNNTYDLMIFDIMIPFINGIELCKEVRKHKINSPIIILTAKSEEEDVIAGLDAGADDYIKKPFSLHELLARIRALSRRGTSNTSVLSFKELSLDSLKKVVKRKDKVIDLTAKEFAILECLMKNQNQTLSESMIIDYVWDMNYNNASNLVKVYIYRLRNKIDKIYDENYIHNIKNIGYILK